MLHHASRNSQESLLNDNSFRTGDVDEYPIMGVKFGENFMEYPTIRGKACTTPTPLYSSSFFHWANVMMGKTYVDCSKITKAFTL